MKVLQVYNDINNEKVINDKIFIFKRTIPLSGKTSIHNYTYGRTGSECVCVHGRFLFKAGNRCQSLHCSYFSSTRREAEAL